MALPLSRARPPRHQPRRRAPACTTGRGQHVIDQLERREAGQHAEVTRRQRLDSYRDRPDYGNPIRRAGLLVRMLFR